jgi:hypothetical protein
MRQPQATDRDEARRVRQVGRPLVRDAVPEIPEPALRDIDLEDQQRDGNGEHPIAKRLQAAGAPAIAHATGFRHPSDITLRRTVVPCRSHRDDRRQCGASARHRCHRFEARGAAPSVVPLQQEMRTEQRRQGEAESAEALFRQRSPVAGQDATAPVDNSSTGYALRAGASRAGLAGWPPRPRGPTGSVVRRGRHELDSNAGSDCALDLARAMLLRLRGRGAGGSTPRFHRGGCGFDPRRPLGRSDLEHR